MFTEPSERASIMHLRPISVCALAYIGPDYVENPRQRGRSRNCLSVNSSRALVTYRLHVGHYASEVIAHLLARRPSHAMRSVSLPMRQACAGACVHPHCPAVVIGCSQHTG